MLSRSSEAVDNTHFARHCASNAIGEWLVVATSEQVASLTTSIYGAAIAFSSNGRCCFEMLDLTVNGSDLTDAILGWVQTVALDAPECLA